MSHVLSSLIRTGKKLPTLLKHYLVNRMNHLLVFEASKMLKMEQKVL